MERILHSRRNGRWESLSEVRQHSFEFGNVASDLQSVRDTLQRGQAMKRADWKAAVELSPPDYAGAARRFPYVPSIPKIEHVTPEPLDASSTSAEIGQALARETN